MNVKPKDMAIVIRQNSDHGIGLPSLLSKICTVLSAAPRRSFTLPDGNGHMGCEPKFWLVKFANPIEAPAGVRRTQFKVKTQYACLPDFVLRRIGDVPGADQTLDWADVPSDTVEQLSKSAEQPEGVPA